MRELVGQMAEAVQRARAELPEPEAFVVHRPAAEGYRIERGDDGAWTVVGRQAERAVALSDLTNVEALDEAHRRLRALGVDKALARAGARPGDTVHIGRLAFDYEDDARDRRHQDRDLVDHHRHRRHRRGGGGQVLRRSRRRCAPWATGSCS